MSRPARQEQLALFGTDEHGNAWLQGAQCSQCDAVLFPPRSACPFCGNLDTRPLRLGRTGRLEEVTVCRVAPEGFTAPYVLGAVVLDEGPRVYSVIDVPPERAESAVGQVVAISVGPLGTSPDGAPIVGWKYRMIDSQ